MLFVVVMALYVGWILLTYYWSFAPAATVRQGVTHLQLLAFVWLAAEYGRDLVGSMRFAQAFVLGNYVAFAVTLGNAAATGFTGFRDVGSFDANEFAAVLALGIPIAALLVAHGRPGALHVLNAAYPVFAVFGVVLAASRGGLIATLVALLVVPFSFARFGSVRRLALLVGALLAVWGSFSYAPRAFPQLVANLERLSGTTEELTEGTLTNRTLIWAETLDVFWSSPMIGVGAGATRHVLASRDFGRPVVAHNAFLAVAAATGVVGFLLFLSAMSVAAIGALLAPPAYRPFLLVLVATLLVAMLPISVETRKSTWFVLVFVALQRPLLISWSRRIAEPLLGRKHLADTKP
jgi:O-antigen ligase